MTWGVNISNVICPYPASCMGKTVKNKSLLLIYTTVNMPELGVTAGIVAVSPITNYTSTEIAHMPMPESKRGGCKDSCYLETTRAQTKEKLYTYSYWNVFFEGWESLSLEAASAESSASLEAKMDFASLLFFQLLHLSFLMQGNTIIKNTSFEGQP